MPQARPSYIWRKSASSPWLRTHEASLHQMTGGDHATIEKPGRKRLLIERFCPTEAIAQQLRAVFGGAIVELSPTWEAEAFAAMRIKPLRIGKRLIIASDAADLEADSVSATVLIIPAGVAFGTGGHATTAMSLRILERTTRRLPNDWRMFDAGTGSGILALAGRCFGAAEVVAIDNDARAIATAKANATRNGIRGVHFTVGDAKQTPRRQFDIIAANLYSELLAEALPLWRHSLSRGGRLILSGVMRSQEQAVRRVLRSNGYRVDETRRRGKWIALRCGQKPS